jgi:hypothetical protein
MTPPLPTQPAFRIAPFEFATETVPTEGCAFSLTFQALVWLLVAGLGVWLFVLWQQDKFGNHTDWHSARRAGWFILGWLLLAWTALQVRKSRTRIDAQGLSQSWIWDKHMPFEQLAYSQMIRVKGLEWLIAPRFYVRTLAGKFAVFYIAHPSLQRECERLGLQLQAFRRL